MHQATLFSDTIDERYVARLILEKLDDESIEELRRLTRSLCTICPSARIHLAMLTAAARSVRR